MYFEYQYPKFYSITNTLSFKVQSHPGYPYLGYPKPRLSERSSERGVCFKNGILTKIADSTTEQSTCVCVSYVYVQCGHTVVRHRVQCEV